MKFVGTLLLLTGCLLAPLAQAQTSWKGTTSTSWNNAANWTAGVPTSTLDAIIGDANFTGVNPPTVNVASVCKSLTLGAGSTASTLTISKNLTVSGDVTIGANGTVAHSSSVTLSLTGNWTNSGTYSGSAASALVTFAGAAQSLSGATTFKRLTINAGSTTTLNANISVGNILTIDGTLDPGATPGFAVSGAGKITVGSGGNALVRAPTFAGSYALTGTKTLSTGSTVEYAATGNQTVDNSLTYRTLRISGSGIKSLTGNLPSLSSSTTSQGNLDVAGGTLDLATFTAHRNNSTTGGTLSIAAGATLRIGGTNSFPANYATHSLGASSTVEYYGTNQTVTAESYGHLILSSSGAATKTLPAAAFTVAGNLSSATNAAGASVSFTAGAAITVNGNVTLGGGTTFNGGAFSHSVGANWTNNGTFTGATSTLTMNGPGGVLTGSGAGNFNNLTLAKNGITLTPDASITVAGNLATTGVGTFTHSSGGAGTLTMSGSSKTISGTGISFNHLAISGSASTSDSFTVAGNLNVTGSFSAGAGAITLSGAGKTIYGGGTIALNALNVTGSLSTANNFSVASDVSVSGSLTATAGTATFNGTSSLSGTANLFNVTLNGTRLQLGSAAVLGIAGVFTQTAGTFDVTTSVPNTVTYNSSGAQTILSATYDNLTLTGSGTKTAGGAVTVKRDLTIGSGATFSAGSFTHSLWRNWINNGSFTAGTSTIQLLGNLDVSISGATTFNILTVNKSNSVNVVTLNTNAAAATVNMTSGQIATGTNALTLTATRTGNGIILGTITRTHAFAAGTAYAFESPNNTLSFASLGTVSSVTVTVASGAVGDFPFGGSANRQYTISLTSSGAYLATLRLHYEDAELNGIPESALSLWRYTSGWTVSGKTASDSTTNWVEQSALTDVTGRWTFSASNSVARWNGSVSAAWEDPANWTALQGAPSLPPSTNDIATLGDAAFVNPPVISSAAQARSVTFGSAQAVTLTLGAGGSLTTGGNIGGDWTNNITHTIALGAQTLNVGGDLTLSDGTASHAIHLSLGTGTVTLTGSLSESGGANITFTGAGVLKIGGDFNATSGTFTAGSGTVIYNGAGAQSVAGVAYNRLAFEKTGGNATLAAATTVGSDLTLTNSGTFTVLASLTIAGSVVVDTGTTLTIGSAGATLSVGGGWTRLGTFTPGSATVALNGAGAQVVTASTFNHLTINKSAGTATLAGNLTLSGDLSATAGTLDLAGFTADRSTVGGTFTLASGTTLKVGNSFPSNFSTRTLSASSTVEYTRAGAQTVSGETYGNLIFSNGGSNAKTLAAAATVAGDLLISSNATFAGSSFLVTLSGNWTNNGTFNPGTGTIKLDGAGRFVSGDATFTNLTVSGSYTVAAGALVVHGNLSVSGTFDVGAGSATLDGDLVNTGSLTSSGTTTFTGTRVQTLQLLGALVSSSSGVINFNGSVAPVLFSTTSPTFVTVNINNTAGITPSVGWTVHGPFGVAAASAFHAGSAAHNFYHAFLNNGTVTSSGTLNFQPAVSTTVKLGGVSFASTGTVSFGGASQISLIGNGALFNIVVVANTHAAGVTANTNWALAGGLTISSGASFHAGTGLLHTIAGDVTTDGTLDGQTSLVVLNGTTVISGNGSATFNHLTVSGTATAAGGFAVSGNFTNNGAFDSTGVDVTFNGSAASFIAGSTTPTPVDSLVIAKTSATVTLAVNVNSLTALNISSGTLDSSTFTITEAAGGVLTVGAGATLKLGGSNPLPAFDTYSLDPLSLVEFGGTGTQTIAAQNYGGLTSSSTGARTLASSGTIGISGMFTPGANTYTITGSTVDFNGAGAQAIPAFNYQNLTSSSTGARTLSGTIGVAGTFTPGANSFTVTGSTMNFNGGAQTIPAFTYGNLTTSGSGAKTLGGNATVSGNVNFSAGSFADGGFTLTANGDVASTVTHSGAGKILLSGGSTNHVLSGGGAFQNLELSDTNGAALNLTNLTVNGALTLTSGRISTSTNKVIIAASGSVTRTNGHVNGSLQKNVATGATTRTFEIGDAPTYAPATVAFGNVTTAGNLVASTTAGDHSDIANSGIAATRSVNRSWTITNSGVVFNNYSATLNFVAADIDAGADTSTFVIAQRTSGTWALPTVGTRTSTNTQATGMTSFSEFQVGQSSSVPAITNQPASQRVNLGASATFTVAAAGATPLWCQWRFNGTAISGATNTSYSIASAQNSDAGTYSCLVTNANGSDLSSNAVLTINHAPAATNDSLQRYSTSGAKVRVTTLLTNDTDADADPLTLGSVGPASAQGGMVVASGAWVFYTPAVGFTNADSFTCVIADSGGLLATGSVSVTIVVDLNPAQNITAIEDFGGNASRVQFLGIASRTYTIQYTTNLVTPSWQPLGTATANATGRFEFTDSPPLASPARFYRSTYP